MGLSGCCSLNSDVDGDCFAGSHHEFIFCRVLSKTFVILLSFIDLCYIFRNQYLGDIDITHIYYSGLYNVITASSPQGPIPGDVLLQPCERTVGELWCYPLSASHYIQLSAVPATFNII